MSHRRDPCYTAAEISLDPRVESVERYFERAAQLDIGERNGRRLLGLALGAGELDHNKWAEAGIITRRLSNQLQPLRRLTVEKILTSPTDGFKKLILRTPDDLLVETVVIPLEKENRVTICLSSQIGCVMGCTFCATARMTKRRNLEQWEIVDQFLHAREAANREGKIITGAVFMGMGEPFLNYANVISSARLFSYPLLNAISAKAITVSTVGLLPEIERFTREKQPFRLSISIGAATDEKRARLVPIAARNPIVEVMAAARRHAEARKTRVMISYVCIGGENVGSDDAEALARMIGDTPVRLDLIDVNDGTGRYRPPSPQEMGRFRDALTRHLRQPVVRRYSGGADIRAACGTLSGDQLTTNFY